MIKKLLALFALLAVMVGTAAAQDARAVLQAAAKTMGADNLKTIQISGTGVTSAVGQSSSPNDDWPREKNSLAGQEPIHRAAAAERRFRANSSRNSS